MLSDVAGQLKHDPACVTCVSDESTWSVVATQVLCNCAPNGRAEVADCELRWPGVQYTDSTVVVSLAVAGF